MDLAAWWQARRFVGLLDLIDSLPPDSRLNEAVQNDPEQAELIARAREEQADDSGSSWSPPVSQYDLHAAMLRELIQSVAQLRAAVLAARTGKEKTVPTVFPAPVTEVDRAARRMQQRWADNLIEIFTPHAARRR